MYSIETAHSRGSTFFIRIRWIHLGEECKLEHIEIHTTHTHTHETLTPNLINLKACRAASANIADIHEHIYVYTRSLRVSYKSIWSR